MLSSRALCIYIIMEKNTLKPFHIYFYMSLHQINEFYLWKFGFSPSDYTKNNTGRLFRSGITFAFEALDKLAFYSSRISPWHIFPQLSNHFLTTATRSDVHWTVLANIFTHFILLPFFGYSAILSSFCAHYF